MDSGFGPGAHLDSGCTRTLHWHQARQVLGGAGGGQRVRAKVCDRVLPILHLRATVRRPPPRQSVWTKHAGIWHSVQIVYVGCRAKTKQGVCSAVVREDPKTNTSVRVTVLCVGYTRGTRHEHVRQLPHHRDKGGVRLSLRQLHGEEGASQVSVGVERQAVAEDVIRLQPLGPHPPGNVI